MDLTRENSFQIQNNVYCFGNPVITVDTLQQLVSALQEHGETNRPIVIINPQANTIPNFDSMLENFISNEITVKPASIVTKYMLQNATDEQICEFAEQQYKPENGLSLDYLITMYTLIREQSNLRGTLDDLKAESDSLWKQHCLNPESDTGSERYGDIVYNIVPAVNTQLREVTHKLDTLSDWFTEPEVKYTPKHQSDITEPEPIVQDTDIVTVQKSPDVTDTVEPVCELDTVLQNIDNNIPDTVPVEPVIVPEPSVQDTPIPDFTADDTEVTVVQTPHNILPGGTTITLKWLNSKLRVMPLSIARNRAQEPGYIAIRNQQESAPKEYIPVSLEYLLMLGIPIYPDGVPVVYTKSGEFMRVGTSEIPMNNTKYWFPRPMFDVR